jgi:hypothetical protein
MTERHIAKDKGKKYFSGVNFFGFGGGTFGLNLSF